MDIKKDIAEEYVRLQKKYSLPSLNVLDDDFEIVNIIADHKFVPNHMLSVVRRRMAEACFSWINYLHMFIVPNQQSAINLEEFNIFSDDEKKAFSKIIDRLMYYSRLSLSLELTKDEAADADFIKSLFAEWPEIKKALSPVVQKNISHWKNISEKS